MRAVALLLAVLAPLSLCALEAGAAPVVPVNATTIGSTPTDVQAIDAKVPPSREAVPLPDACTARAPVDARSDSSVSEVTCAGIEQLAEENARLRQLVDELQQQVGTRAPRGTAATGSSGSCVRGDRVTGGHDPARARDTPACSTPRVPTPSVAGPTSLPATAEGLRYAAKAGAAAGTAQVLLPLPASDDMTDAAWIVTCSVAAACV